MFKTTGLALLLLAGRLRAQEAPVHLSLRQAIDTSLRYNQDLQLAGLDERIAASRAREANAVYLPRVDVSYSALATNDPLNAFGFRLQQRSVKSPDFNPDWLNHPGGTADFMTQLQVQEPLVNLDQAYQRRAARQEAEMYRLKNNRSREYVAFEATKAYLQLQLAGDAVGVLEDALRAAQALDRFTRDRVNQGLLQESDALNVQVHLHAVETRLAEARSEVRNASDYLSLVMGKPYGTLYLPDTGSLGIRPPAPTDTLIPDNRSDLAALRAGLEAAGLMIRSERSSLLPRLNGFASYQFHDAAATGFQAGSYLAGLRLSWTLFEGGRVRNRIATRKLERDRLASQLTQQQRQSQLELTKALRQLEDAGYRISQQRLAVTQAAEALRILEDRYEQGLVNSTDVLMAQAQLSQQKLEFAGACFHYHLTAAYSQFLVAAKSH